MIKATQALAHINICSCKSAYSIPPDFLGDYQAGQKNNKAEDQNTKKKQSRVKQRAEKTQKSLHFIRLKKHLLGDQEVLKRGRNFRNSNTSLLHCVAVSQGNCLVLKGLKIYRDTQGRSHLIVPPVVFAYVP